MLTPAKQPENQATKPTATNGSFFGGRGSVPFFQAKLTVNQPGDAHEREADAVADQVMRMKAGEPPIIQRMPVLTVQRACASCETEKDKEKEGIQRKENSGGEAGGKAAPSIVSDVLSSGGGQTMDGSTQQFMESRFGQDFSQVRIHTDARAAESASAIQARAYTSGKDVVFGAGEYQPGSEGGRSLLAHELVHVGQQGEARFENSIQRHAGGTQRHLRRVVVNQTSPGQQVSLEWNNGETESAQCSTGKGHCCFDPGAEQGGACTPEYANRVDTNCTPIGAFQVTSKVRDHAGINFWTQFHDAKGVALHEYDPVDGTPLSHGCVRLDATTAEKIFNGARVGNTEVRVENLAVPRCDNTNLQAEWANDFETAGSRPLDGTSINPFTNQPFSSRDIQRNNRGIEEERRALRSALGVDNAGLDQTIGIVQTDHSAVGSKIPRCIPTQTTEESRLPAAQQQSLTLPRSRFAQPFEQALTRTGSFADAQRIVRTFGTQLWESQTRAGQPAGTTIDDRQLYWTRLEMTQFLRSWNPAWRTRTGAGGDTLRRNRAALLQLFEQASRGMLSIQFPTTPGLKRILLSGFDPFGLDSNLATSNPSAVLALSLDGQSVTIGNLSGQIESVVFPVRFADFNEGFAEQFFQPFLQGPDPVDLIIALGQGGAPEIEQFAGAGRTTTYSDNQNTEGGQSSAGLVRIPGTTGGADFYDSTLPSGIEHGTSIGRPQSQRPEVTGSSITAGGTGGDYLCNELLYRLLHLQATTTATDPTTRTIPVGFIHVPNFGELHTEASLRDNILQVIRQTLQTTTQPTETD